MLNDLRGDLCIIDDEEWHHIRPWKLFGDLIRQIYGPMCGVYLVVKGPLTDNHDEQYEIMELI